MDSVPAQTAAVSSEGTKAAAPFSSDPHVQPAIPGMQTMYEDDDQGDYAMAAYSTFQ